VRIIEDGASGDGGNNVELVADAPRVGHAYSKFASEVAIAYAWAAESVAADRVRQIPVNWTQSLKLVVERLVLEGRLAINYTYIYLVRQAIYLLPRTRQESVHRCIQQLDSKNGMCISSSHRYIEIAELLLERHNASEIEKDTRKAKILVRSGLRCSLHRRLTLRNIPNECIND
jgi:hypothetical protein